MNLYDVALTVEDINSAAGVNITAPSLHEAAQAASRADGDYISFPINTLDLLVSGIIDHTRGRYNNGDLIINGRTDETGFIDGWQARVLGSSPAGHILEFTNLKTGAIHTGLYKQDGHAGLYRGV